MKIQKKNIQFQYSIKFGSSLYSSRSFSVMKRRELKTSTLDLVLLGWELPSSVSQRKTIFIADRCMRHGAVRMLRAVGTPDLELVDMLVDSCWRIHKMGLNIGDNHNLWPYVTGKIAEHRIGNIHTSYVDIIDGQTEKPHETTWNQRTFAVLMERRDAKLAVVRICAERNHWQMQLIWSYCKGGTIYSHCLWYKWKFQWQMSSTPMANQCTSNGRPMIICKDLRLP